MNKKTILIRAPKEIVEQWHLNFPNVSNPDMIRFTWDSSLIKLENRLRKKR